MGGGSAGLSLKTPCTPFELWRTELLKADMKKNEIKCFADFVSGMFAMHKHDSSDGLEEPYWCCPFQKNTF